MDFNREKAHLWLVGLGIAGNLASIFGAVWAFRSDLPSIVAAAIVIFNIIFMIGISCFLVVLYVKYKNIRKETTEAIDINKDMINKMAIYYFDIENTLSKIILRTQRSINNYTNQRRRLIEARNSSVKDLPPDSAEFHDRMLEFMEDLKKAKESHYNEIMSLTKQLYGKIFDYTVETIQLYLKSKKINLPVALSAKIIVHVPAGNYYNAKVKTYFRDKNTFREEKREIWKREYTVSGNSHLSNLINKKTLRESYYINNDLNSSNYDNEVVDYIKRYDAIASVSIARFDQEKRIYGFLTCDVKKNTEYPSDVFDETICRIMLASATVLAIFYNSIEKHWDLLITNTEDSRMYADIVV